MIIGVIFSLFTAVLIGRLVIDWWTINKERELSFWTGVSKNAFSKMKFNWLGKRRIAYAISGLIIVLGLASMFTRGFDLGVDFKGGYSYNIQFDQDAEISADILRDGLTEHFGGSTPVVKSVNVENTFNVVTDYNIDDDSEGAADKVLTALHTGVNAMVGGNLEVKRFKDPDFTGTHITSSSKVGPTIADDITRSSYYAAIFALLTDLPVHLHPL